MKPNRVNADERWIRARQKLLRQLRAEVRRRLGPEAPDVLLYASRLEREMRRKWTISSKAELLAQIEHADIVYGGDFHALAQAQRTHLKILRALSDERPVVLALECFTIRAQKWLDLFCDHQISVEELRRKTKWDRDWGFPWDHYRPLFELARRRRFRLLGLNSGVGHKDSIAAARLSVREQVAAKVIRDALRRAPGSLVYVIFGDLHIATDHMPSAVQNANERSPLNQIIVHLNSDRIYFQLARSGLELDVDVVKFGGNRVCSSQFCVLSSPPWVKWQSYLFFLDRSGDIDLDEGDGESDFDPTDQVAELVRLAARDLGIEIPVNDLTVYLSENERAWGRIHKALRPKDREMARQLLTSGRSFFMPTVGGFLGRETVNHAAAIAGQYLHSVLSRRTQTLWNVPKDFTALIWCEAVAFFVSKLVNHKRQADTLADLKAQLAMGVNDRGSEAMRLALDQRLSELVLLNLGRRRSLKVHPRRRASYLDAARILGGMMGERLYLAYRSRKLTLTEVVAMMSRDLTSGSCKKDYEEILRRIEDAIASGASRRTRNATTVMSDSFAGIKSKKERL